MPEDKLKELRIFLDEVNIPEIKPKPKTFLGIAKQPHYENVISNIYAFFFDRNEEHGFKDLFINSLIDIIRESENFENGQLDELDELVPDTEVPTNKGGRIDILLSNKDQAIIIENKIFHVLNNDLDDYWDSSKKENKFGVVLSLYPISDIKNPNFINITHKVLLDKIISNSGMYLLDGSDKYLVLLKDLYQNILNMSSKEMNTEEVKVYLEKQEKINEVVKFEQRIKESVVSEVEKACKILSEERPLNLVSKRNDRYRYFASPANRNLVFAVIFDGLFNPKSEIRIIVEPRYGEIAKARLIDKSIFTAEEEKKIKNEFYTNTNNKWGHFATGSYKLNEEEYSDLSQFIVEKIKSDHFLSIFNKLEQHLKEVK